MTGVAKLSKCLAAARVFYLRDRRSLPAIARRIHPISKKYQELTMRLLLLATILCGFATIRGAEADTATDTGTLIQISGVDVGGTTENVSYLAGGRYTLLTSFPVNTTVSYGPYAYSGVFYLPHNIPLGSIVVTNQAGANQTGFNVQQVTPVGTVALTTDGGPVTQPGDVGGMLMNISGSDVSGTTEYVWLMSNGVYFLLGSGAVNTTAGYSSFAYNVLFYLPYGVPAGGLVVTNQAGAIQQGFDVQLAVPLGTLRKGGTTIVPVAAGSALTAGRSGQMLRAYGRDVSGTTEYVWNRVGAVYTLLGAAPADATEPHNAYRYNVLFFLPKGLYSRNIVVTNQAGTVQNSATIDGKLPAVVPSGG